MTELELYDQRIARILSKIDALRDREFSFENSWPPVWEPPMPEAEVFAFEEACGIRLPEDYRRFLTATAAEGSHPFYGLFPPTREESAPERPFPYSLDRFPIFLHMTKAELDAFDDDAANSGWLPLCTEGDGMDSVLVVNSADPEVHGTVWYCDFANDFGMAPMRDRQTGRPFRFLDWLEYWADRTAALADDEYFSFAEAVQLPPPPDNPEIMGRKMGWIPAEGSEPEPQPPPEPEAFPLEELRDLLEKAQSAACRRFGAGEFRWNPPASLGEVRTLEKEIGAPLPEEYRNFLLRAGNGGAGPFGGLFSLKEVRSQLRWPVEPERTPYLRPGVEEAAGDGWRRGCIPIGAQSDDAFTYLLVSGPDRGRVVYAEDRVFFPRETGFLAWYTRWLREIIAGYEIGWFATGLDGDQEELCWQYRRALERGDREEALLALTSMKKFPVFTEETQAFLREYAFQDTASPWTNLPDACGLISVAWRAGEETYHRFLDRRWAAGLYGPVVREAEYSLYHLPVDQDALARRWRDRILEKLPELPQDTYESAMRLLLRCGDVDAGQAALLLERAEGTVKRNLPPLLRRMPGAEKHPDLWFPLLEQREDLELLRTAILTVPPDPRLRETLEGLQKEFAFSAEQIVHVDRQDPEAMKRAVRRQREYEVYQAACTAWRNTFREPIPAGAVSFPRPYQLEMVYWDIRNLGMDRPPPPEGIPIHPLIALALLEERRSLPITAYDWGKTLAKVKRLRLRLNRSTVRAWKDEERQAVLRGPDEHAPPPPYYFDLCGWSVIGRMPELRQLEITGIWVEDFSFLTSCGNLQTLSLQGTNFSDCRLLRKLPKLKRIDLRQCPLTHREALEGLSLEEAVLFSGG